MQKNKQQKTNDTMGNENSKSHSKKQQIQQERRPTTNNRKKKFSSSISSSLSHDSSSNSSSFSRDDRSANQNDPQMKQTNQIGGAQFPMSAASPSTNQIGSRTKSTNQNTENTNKLNNKQLNGDFEDAVNKSGTNNNHTDTNFDRNERRRSSVGATPSKSRTFDQADRRTRFKDLRYQSVRGTSFEPKLKLNIINKNATTASNSSSFDHQSNVSNSNKDKHFEKSTSKKGKRINTIKFMQRELWDPFEVGDRTCMNFTLHPYFSVNDKPGELTCHTLALNFLRVPDEKLERRLQLYDFEIIFTETKLAVKTQQQEQIPSNPTHKLIRAHTFYGSSRSVKVNDRSALIEGNFYNPEYGKMDFFQFELKLVPVQFRELDRPTELDYINNIYNHENSNNNSNNITTTNNDNTSNTNNSNPSTSVKTMTVDELFGTVRRLIKPVTKRSLSNQSHNGYRETWWGSFIMKVRGSYKSKEYTFQVYERHQENEIPKSKESAVVSKESCIL